LSLKISKTLKREKQTDNTSGFTAGQQKQSSWEIEPVALMRN
jgi:hypothetical protein